MTDTTDLENPAHQTNDRPALYVGDYVRALENPAQTLLVAERTTAPAHNYTVGETNTTVADIHPEYDPDDEIFLVAHPQPSITELTDFLTYPVPRARLELERYRAGFYGLFPFMLFGGALRVVEDTNVAAYRETGELALGLPWVGVLISPLIYFTVFFIALLALVTSVWLDRNKYVSGYEYPLFGIGTGLLAITLAYLGYRAATEPYATLHPALLATILVGATVTTVITWLAINQFAPDINSGTRFMGVVVIWAHAIDGVANVAGLDWATVFGLPANLVPKHPINEAIVTYTGVVLPESVTSVTGTAWPFLLVKLVAAVVVVTLFNDEIFEECPQFAYLLMIAVVAVGLGPGTRDMLRATFGV